MKNKTIQTGICTIFFVEAPEVVENWEIIPGNLLLSKDSRHFDMWGENSNPKYVLVLPEGNWQLLCKVSELTEEIACSLVEYECDEGEKKIFIWIILLDL